MLMSHQAPSKPYQVVIRLWLEPGGGSVVPSRARAWASMPATVPISESPILAQDRHVAGHHHVRALRDTGLVQVDVEQAGPALRFDRVVRGQRRVGHRPAP